MRKSRPLWEGGENEVVSHPSTGLKRLGPRSCFLGLSEEETSKYGRSISDFRPRLNALCTRRWRAGRGRGGSRALFFPHHHPVSSCPGHQRRRCSPRDACPTAPPPGQGARQQSRETASPGNPSFGASSSRWSPRTEARPLRSPGAVSHHPTP